MTKRGLPDVQDLGSYRLGFKTALEMAETIARRDHRVDLAKDCGYIPSWQRGRWAVADELAGILKKISAVDGESADGGSSADR